MPRQAVTYEMRMIMQKTDFDSIATEHEEVMRKPPFCPLPLTTFNAGETF